VKLFHHPLTPYGCSTHSEDVSDQSSNSSVDNQEITSDLEGDTMARGRTLVITPPRFKGSIEENVEEYLQAFERVSRANGCNEAKKLVVIPCYLEGAALKWDENLEQAQGEALTWDVVKSKMKEAFQSIAWED
jgi:hypothetical protein